MKNTRVAAIAFGLVVAGTIACGGASGGGEPLSKEARADLALGAKLTPYIELGNLFFERVRSSRRRYLSWVADPKAGPTCKERHIYGVYTLAKGDLAFKKVQEANESKPHIKKLEQAATRLLLALDKLQRLLADASRYYRQKDYKDDGCKKAQKLHPRLMRLFAEFDTNEKVFSGIVFAESHKLHQRLLARIEKKHGKEHPRYYHKKIALDARALVKLMPEEKADVSAAGKALASLDAIVKEMISSTRSGKNASSLSSFRQMANSFVAAAKQRLRRIKSKKAYTASERRRMDLGAGSMVRGSYAKLVKAFNRLIEAGNRVTFK